MSETKDTALVLDSTGAPALVIPRRHQSAPKQHWADKEVQKAAIEIAAGQYIIKPDADEVFNYGPTMDLAQHPRVQEAMARMELEKEECNSQELFEKEQALFEMNEMASQADKWDGQGRWMGKDNEAMRVVNIMSPFTFMEKLRASGVSESRVRLNSFAVNKRAALLSTEYDFKKATRVQVQVGTLQYPCGPEWMVMRFDDYGVPIEAKYLGWRTALLSMISLGVITEKEAHKAFPLASGQVGDWYREQLQVLRGKKLDPGKYVN